MRLIAFTNNQFSPGEGELLTRILPLVDALHIRKESKDQKQGDLAVWQRLIEELPRQSSHKIWIHDHYELALDYHLGGIHLTRQALAVNKGLGVFAALHNLNASISCHELSEARSMGDMYEQVFICPLFDSISKAGHQGAFVMKEIEELLVEDHEAEFIGLGGIDLDKIETVHQLGFDGIAVLGALWQSENPVAFLDEMNRKCKNLETSY